MKVRTINYQRTYNTGNYTSIRLGAEIELDDGDSSTEAFFKAKEIIDAEYKLLMPEPPTFGFAPSEIKVSKEVNPATPDTRTREEKQADLIRTFTKIEKPDGLKSMELIVKSKPYLQSVYDEKMDELTKSLNNEGSKL